MIDEAKAFSFLLTNNLRWTKSLSRIRDDNTTWQIKLVRTRPRVGRVPYSHGRPSKSLQIAVRLPEGSEPTAVWMLDYIAGGSALTMPKTRHEWRIFRFFNGVERQALLDLAK